MAVRRRAAYFSEARTYFLLRKVNGDWKTLNTYGFSADRDVAQEFKSRDAKLAKLQAFVVKVRDGVYKSLDDIDRELYDWEFGDEKAKGYRVMPRMPIDPKTGKQIWPEDIVAPPGAGDGIVVPLPDPARAAANSAKRIVFILDGSQAAKPSFDSLILHIRNAVDDLKSSQSFGVLISGNGKLLKLDEKDLLPATAQNKQKVGALTKGVEAGGKSDFAAALTAAVALKPELIYLTACDLPADAKLVDTARVLTKNQNVKINVIAIEIKGSAEKELKTIATESGGAFRWISIKDLEQQ